MLGLYIRFLLMIILLFLVTLNRGKTRLKKYYGSLKILTKKAKKAKASRSTSLLLLWTGRIALKFNNYYKDNYN